MKWVRAWVVAGAAIGTASCAVIAGLDSDAFTAPSTSNESGIDPGDVGTIELEGGAEAPPCQLEGEWGAPTLLGNFDGALDAAAVAEESVREGPDGCLYPTLVSPVGVRLYRMCPGGPVEPIVIEREYTAVLGPFRHATFVPGTKQVVFNGIALLDGGPDGGDLDILVAEVDGTTFKNPRRFEAANTPSSAVNDTALDDIDPYVDRDGGLTFVRAKPLLEEGGSATSELRRSTGPDFTTSAEVPLLAPTIDGGPAFAPAFALPLLAPDGFLYVSLVRTGTTDPTVHRGALTPRGLESIAALPIGETFSRSFAVGVSANGCTLYLRAQTTADPIDRTYVLRKPAMTR